MCFFEFLFSILKVTYKICVSHSQVNRQTGVAEKLSNFSSSFINNVLLDAQINEYKKELSTKTNTNVTTQNKTKLTLAAHHAYRI